MKPFLLFAIVILPLLGYTQRPFEKEIDAFKKRDSISFPKKDAILFVGSSSFRLWKTLKSDFPKYAVINRGFGGSSLPDVIRYADQIIFPYQPKQVIIYCGENDIAGGTSAKEMFSRFKTLFGMIREKLPNATITFVSMKPSPSRYKFIDEVREGNSLVRDFLKSHKNTSYVDLFSPMLKPDGKPDESLFVEDMLHMNKKGYAIWAKAVKPVLK